MGFWSSVGSFCSSVVSSVSRAASAVWETTKDIASKAVGWMAEKAESFVDNVKEVWRTVKPYIEQTRKVLQTAAKVVGIPWLSSALTMLDKGLGALIAFEDSPIAKKVDGSAIGSSVYVSVKNTADVTTKYGFVGAGLKPAPTDC